MAVYILFMQRLNVSSLKLYLHDVILLINHTLLMKNPRPGGFSQDMDTFAIYREFIEPGMHMSKLKFFQQPVEVYKLIA
jgi:hypothetical protein